MSIQLEQPSMQSPMTTVPLEIPQFCVDDVVKFLDDAKAEQIVKIDLKQQSPFADFIIIANGRSQRHLKALGENLRHYLYLQGMPSVRIEGANDSEWVLVDGGDVIVHLFKPDVRELYNLEKLWTPTLLNVA